MMPSVAHFIETEELGGAERVLLTLASGLEASGWRCVVIHPPGARRFHALAREAGVRTVALPPVRSVRDVAAFGALVRWLRHHPPDVVHAHLSWVGRCLSGLMAARLAGIDAVVATHQLLPPAIRRRERPRHVLVSLLADRHIAVSNDMGRRLMGERWLARKVRVIRNAVAAPAPARVDATDAVSVPRVLALTRLDGQKGLTYLLEAAARVPDARFLIAGDGPQRSRLEDRARALGVADRVTFLGYRTDVAALLAACDVFVLPSLYEGLPLSVLEAMAAGKAVVASDVPGTDEAVIDGVTGLLVPPANADALAAAIRRLVADPTLAATLGRAARARARAEFSAEGMVQLAAATYEELLSRRRRWLSSTSRRKTLATGA